MKVILKVTFLLITLTAYIGAAIVNFDCGRTTDLAYDYENIFSSPSLQKQVDLPIFCTYTIEAVDDSKVVNITFFYFKIKSEAECALNYVKIWDGNSTDGQLLSHKCGGDSPGIVISTKKLVTLQYVAKSQAQGDGFYANITQVNRPDGADCGPLLVKASDRDQIFQSSGQGNFVPYQINCEYQISTTHSKAFLKLNFKKISINNLVDCDKSFVKIYDGDAPAVTYCGNVSPKDVRSTGGSMKVAYQAPNQPLYGGFQAVLTQEVSCGNTELVAKEQSEILQSPGDETGLPSYIDCIYTITTESPQYAINLIFKKFKIIDHPNCEYGYVKIYDGAKTEANLISFKCGNDSPGDITSKTGTLIVNFMVETLFSGEGFTAEYKQVQKSVLPPIQCNQLLTVAAGESTNINMYDGESTLQRGRICLISIKTDMGNQLEVTFTEFHFKGNNGSCADSDYLQMGDGLKLQPGAAKMCGPKPPNPYVSPSNEMFIDYLASDSKETKGFKATVKSVAPTIQCNQMLSVPAGGSANINMYESTLQRDKHCLVSIRTTTGYHLHLKFSSFQFKGTNGSCTDSDYLQFGNGLTLQSGAAKMCGTEPPSTFVSSGSDMFLSYIATDPTGTKGFKATVMSVSAAGWKGVSICLMALLFTFSIIAA